MSHSLHLSDPNELEHPRGSDEQRAYGCLHLPNFIQIIYARTALNNPEANENESNRNETSDDGWASDRVICHAVSFTTSTWSRFRDTCEQCVLCLFHFFSLLRLRAVICATYRTYLLCMLLPSSASPMPPTIHRVTTDDQQGGPNSELSRFP